MKKKIIGLSVCIIMFSTIIIPVTAITDKQDINRTSNYVDVPIWEVDDEWTYHITESRKVDIAYSLSGDLSYKVVNDSGASYILEATTRPKGRFNLGSIGFKTTMLTFLSMKLQIRKADLGLENFVEKLKGFLLLTVGSLTLPIPIQIIGNDRVEFEPTWVIIPFPLYDGKYGNLSSVEILHVNTTMHLFWGLILAYGPITEAIPFTRIPYTCSREEITVQGRTFDVYNVSAEWMDGSQFVSYYSEEVGNVVKEVIYIPYRKGNVVFSLTLELKDWNYTP